MSNNCNNTILFALKTRYKISSPGELMSRFHKNQGPKWLALVCGKCWFGAMNTTHQPSQDYWRARAWAWARARHQLYLQQSCAGPCVSMSSSEARGFWRVVCFTAGASRETESVCKLSEHPIASHLLHLLYLSRTYSLRAFIQEKESVWQSNAWLHSQLFLRDT